MILEINSETLYSLILASDGVFCVEGSITSFNNNGGMNVLTAVRQTLVWRPEFCANFASPCNYKRIFFNLGNFFIEVSHANTTNKISS